MRRPIYLRNAPHIHASVSYILLLMCKSIKNAGIKAVHSIFLTIFELRYL